MYTFLEIPTDTIYSGYLGLISLDNRFFICRKKYNKKDLTIKELDLFNIKQKDDYLLNKTLVTKKQFE